jgi:hypothetical protein
MNPGFIYSTLVLYLSVGSTVCLSQGDKILGRKRRSFVISKNHTRLKEACLVLVSEKEYKDRRVDEEEPIVCELRGQDLKESKHKLYHRLIRIRGLTTSWAEQNHVMSGSTLFFAQNAFIDDDADELWFPTEEPIQVCASASAIPCHDCCLCCCCCCWYSLVQFCMKNYSSCHDPKKYAS